MPTPTHPLCAICAVHTRDRTVALRLTHGVTVWLCERHASPEYQMRRDGREFAETLERLWHAHGCLTAARRRALGAHVALVTRRPAARARPGSYAWPELRQLAEAEFARGGPALPTIHRLRRELAGGAVTPPSIRTMQRWHRERRWDPAAAGLSAADCRDDVDPRVGPERRLEPGPLAVDVDVHVPAQRRPGLTQAVANPRPALVEAVDRLVHRRRVDVQPSGQVGEHRRQGDRQVEVGHG
jgi:hypothetical protein